jgi:hypothetical protein
MDKKNLKDKKLAIAAALGFAVLFPVSIYLTGKNTKKPYEKDDDLVSDNESDELEIQKGYYAQKEEFQDNEVTKKFNEVVISFMQDNHLDSFRVTDKKDGKRKAIFKGKASLRSATYDFHDPEQKFAGYKNSYFIHFKEVAGVPQLEVRVAKIVKGSVYIKQHIQYLIMQDINSIQLAFNHKQQSKAKKNNI